MEKKIQSSLAKYQFMFKYDDAFALELKERLENGVHFVDLTLRADQPTIPTLTMEWNFPFNDIQARFTGNYYADRYIIPNWTGGMHMAAVSGSPVYALYSASGENRITIGLSDTLSRSHMAADIDEDNECMPITIGLKPGMGATTTQYSLTVRLDERHVPLYVALNELSIWWSGMDGTIPLPAPDAAFRPVYSTWYSYHRHINEERVLREAAIAKELGCETVIVDDGWSIPTSEEETASLGQYDVAIDKFPDMAVTVQKIHNLGMKILLWYAVPFINPASSYYEAMKEYIIESCPSPQYALDPRFPEVREYIINRHLQALKEWNLDGFKLDFIDSYSGYLDDPNPEKRAQPNPKHDIIDYDMAVDTLLHDLTRRLVEQKSDIMIEYRQNYTGPRMRSYANIFRAMDCPLGSHTNRFRTADIRMLAGNSAVHSDMFQWCSEESVEVAALQIINILHCVPQVSGKLSLLKTEHMKMLRYYLDFWNQNRDTLLFGDFIPTSPENLYPVITCKTTDTQISILYNKQIVDVDTTVETLILVNGTHSSYVVADFMTPYKWNISIVDCMGNLISEYEKELFRVCYFSVPSAGIVTMRKA